MKTLFSRLQGHGAALALLALWTLLATDPLWRRLGTHLVGDLGDARLNAWILNLGAERFWNGSWGKLFDANIFYPLHGTVALSEHLYGVSIFLAPFWLWTGNPVLLSNVALLLSTFLGAVGAYWLCFHCSGRRGPAFVGALLFAFGPSHMGRLSHIQLQMSYPIPFGILFFLKFLESRRLTHWHAFLGFSLLQGLSCYYLLFAYGLALGWLALVGRMPLGWRQLPGLLLLALLLAPWMKPYFDVSRDLGLANSLEINRAGSAKLSDFLQPSSNNQLYGRMAGITRNPQLPWEKTLFPGLTALGLFLGFPFLMAWRRRAPTWQAVAVFGLFFVGAIAALGPGEAGSWRLPYGYLYEYIPGLRGLRVPARMSILCDLSFGLVAALVLAQFRRLWLVAVILIGLEQRCRIPLVQPMQAQEIPQVYQWLARQPYPSPTIELPVQVGLTEKSLGYEYEYLSMFHRQPLVNGTSGYFPRPIGQLAKLLESSDVPLGVGIGALQDFGVQLLLLHEDNMPPEAAARFVRGLEQLGIPPVEVFEGTRVYRLPSVSGVREAKLKLSIRQVASVPLPDSPDSLCLSLGLRLQNPGKSRILSERDTGLDFHISISEPGEPWREVGQASGRLLPLLERGGNFSARFLVKIPGPRPIVPFQLRVELEDSQGGRWEQQALLEPARLPLTNPPQEKPSEPAVQTFWREAWTSTLKN